MQDLRDRLIDPRSPDRRPRRAAYALPTLFTAGQHISGILRAARNLSRRHGTLATGAAAAHLHFQTAAHCDRRGRVPRRPGRPHRAHDQHGQRFRPRDGFARRRASPSASRRRCWLSPGASSSSIPPANRAITRIPAARGILPLLPVSAVRRRAAGALQYSEEPGAQESRPARPQIFRGPADSRGRGGGGVGGLRCRRRADLHWWVFSACGWRCWPCWRF